MKKSNIINLILNFFNRNRNSKNIPVEQGEISDIIEQIDKLNDITMDEVMTPRADLETLPIDIKIEEVIQKIDTLSKTRIPIYNEQLDDIRGFIHIKDLAKQIAYRNVDFRQIINNILFVPHSVNLMDLLIKMNKEKTPIAIVVDEHGGTDGLVTAWDILRKILGSKIAENEDADQPPEITKEEDGSYLVDARVHLEDLENELNCKFVNDDDHEEIETIGGLVLFLAGRIPDRAEIIEHNSGYDFEVVSSTPRNINSIRIHKKTGISKQ